MLTIRNRAWRRHKDHVKRRKGMGSANVWKPEKNWKMMYLRKAKLIRARQLGFEYPVKRERQFLDQELPLEA